MALDADELRILPKLARRKSPRFVPNERITALSNASSAVKLKGDATVATFMVKNGNRTKFHFVRGEPIHF